MHRTWPGKPFSTVRPTSIKLVGPSANKQPLAKTCLTLVPKAVVAYVCVCVPAAWRAGDGGQRCPLFFFLGAWCSIRCWHCTFPLSLYRQLPHARLRPTPRHATLEMSPRCMFRARRNEEATTGQIRLPFPPLARARAERQAIFIRGTYLRVQRKLPSDPSRENPRTTHRAGCGASPRISDDPITGPCADGWISHLRYT